MKIETTQRRIIGRFRKISIINFHFSIKKSYLCTMKNVRITAVRKADYKDLQARYENPIEHTCDVQEGMVWVSVDGQKPEGMCPEAWKSMREFVEELARGGGNFFYGWMQNPHSAMISCNDGFRPVSFLLETI